MAGLLAIVTASEEEYNKLADAIDNSAGSTDRMAEIMRDFKWSPLYSNV